LPVETSKYLFSLNVLVIITKYYSGDQIKKNEMGGACNRYGGGDVNSGFWWGNQRERDHLEDRGLDGKDTIKLYL
jgi:hypothetical protein